MNPYLSSIADKFIKLSRYPRRPPHIHLQQIPEPQQQVPSTLLHNDITSSNNAYLKVSCTKFKAEF